MLYFPPTAARRATESWMHFAYLSLAAVLATAACTKEASPPAQVATPPVSPPRVAGATLPGAAPSASESGKTEPECVGPFDPDAATPKTLRIGKGTWTRNGALVAAPATHAASGIVLGVIANLKEPTAENLFNLKRYLDFFAEQKADAILVAGDSGGTREEIEGSLEPLAASGLPVLAIPGNREARLDFHAAVAHLDEKHPNVIDMSQVRLVKLAGASVVSLPGYYDKRFMHMGDGGCLYTKEDVDHLEPIIRMAEGPVVLLAHAEPHGTWREAIDAFQGGNTGDANLTDFIKTRSVPFGVFANILEAGGRATDIDSNVIREGEAKDRLYLNPGLADATEWQLNDGTTSHGIVASLTITEGKASYRLYRAKALTQDEETAAQKLLPPTKALQASEKVASPQ
jgi:Icc-related predicted phosphoesterase